MEHAILHEKINGQQVNFYPETGFDDVMQTDGDDSVTLRMVLEGIDSAVALLQSSLASKANVADVYTKSSVYTKAEANTLYSSKVSKTGDTMSGALTIITNDADSAFVQRDNTFDSLSTPSVIQMRSLRTLDKNGRILGDVRFVSQTNGSQETQMLTRKNKVDNSHSTYYIAVGVNADGSAYTFAPTPATTDNSTKIATTAFTNNLLNNRYGNKTKIYNLTLSANSTMYINCGIFNCLFMGKMLNVGRSVLYYMSAYSNNRNADIEPLRENSFITTTTEGSDSTGWKIKITSTSASASNIFIISDSDLTISA